VLNAIKAREEFRPVAPAVLEDVLARPLAATTRYTLTDPRALRERLHEVRARGYAWVHDEFVDGMSSVAAGIGEASGGVVAAIHVHGPSYRFPAGREEEIGMLVVDAAARVSVALRHGS